ncbi:MULTISPECIES: MlaC/ttg2D family ABC transporter substrate-binding protein [unclassified Sphingomonas]|uniref:MlaC/ttg2D family ABC transporter substrate-binding protein n=1 Tax=unclassified Sphingomonas TaxID=196159 RepID=UPI0006FD9438|nr:MULTISPECIES: ABC transporter substrate-binding protein [unclassified Sphingomonas]KQX20336.1 toluene tolerance protein [Sphingomonas sp. Root1294]KQY67585.1 toluene tolerance protein [Sphingomonas sp. Root50]KRB90620.1 toluene tolerance protein [Sphingomonas sp. Root720]
MNRFTKLTAALMLVGTSAAVPLASVQAAVVANQDAATFISSLGAESFAVLKTGNKAVVRTKFRELLSQHFAIDAIGERLIRRWSSQITPAQKASYKAAIPNFIIGTYSDNLYDYANASMKVVRTAPAGSGFNVVTQVQKPGAQPINAVWSVAKVGGGFKVTNLTVANINLAVTQGQDFDAIIQRKGIDGLIAMMKARG